MVSHVILLRSSSILKSTATAMSPSNLISSGTNTKRIDSVTSLCSDAQKVKRQNHTQSTPSVFNANRWSTKLDFGRGVSLLKATKRGHGDPQCLVQKVLKIAPETTEDSRPLEIHTLALLPRCNRIVHALVYFVSENPAIGIALFAYYPLGHLVKWKNNVFNRRNYKPVPESYIWRFFLQMTQALAVIQGETGPMAGEQQLVLHRDIKPQNFLVVDIGTTYPSFKLHDFDCATLWDKNKHEVLSWCGTFDWQPPENPRINTPAAETWALGACIHFLATGRKPIANTKSNRVVLEARADGTAERACYSSTDRYLTAKVPREVIPINLDAQTQVERGIAPLKLPNFQYSDELNDWMTRCLDFDPAQRPMTTELLSEMGPLALRMLRRMGGTAALADMEPTF